MTPKNTPLPTAEELYDAIMGKIDTDLLSGNVHASEKRRAKETDAQFAARMARYRKAFALYQKCFDSYIGSLRAGYRQMEKLKRMTNEKAIKAQDDAAEEKLLKQIADL